MKQPKTPTLGPMHRCFARGCEREVPRQMLMCRAHWYAVPVKIRRQVRDAYHLGEGDWRAAVEAAVSAVADKEGK